MLRQAISYARARMTGVWISKNDPVGAAEFSVEDIHAAVRHIRHTKSQGETVIAFPGITPLRVTYVPIVADVHGVVARNAD